MRVLCFVLSLLLHAGVVSLGLYLAVQFPLARTVGLPVYRVDLVDLSPEPAPTPEPPPPAGPQSEKPEPPPPSVPSSAKPVARRAPAPRPALRPAAPAPQAPAPAPPERGRFISPRMDPNVGLLEQMAASNASEAPALGLAETTSEGDGSIRVAGTHGFATFADTFGLDMCGADTFAPEEYFGHYRVGAEQFVSVIDGLKEHVGFLFYDSRTGLFRRLTRVSGMIFTYGPGFSRASPVAGSVTVLPKKDRYNNEHIAKPNQLIWLPEDPPMRYGTLIRFQEREVRFESDGLELPGTLVIRPEGRDAPGVVLAFCSGCVPRERIMGFARALALRGLAVLAYDARPCARALPEGPGGLRLLAGDALAAVRFLRAQPGVLARRVGLWGRGNGTRVALAAAMDEGADFVVLGYGPEDSGPPPDGADAARVRVPSLWLFAGPGEMWEAATKALDASRAGRKAVLLPDLPEDRDPDLNRAKPLALRFGAVAGPWIREGF
ncbi:dienelactone hydrolase family protein [Desulfocurvus sp. DL9XJH121]